MNRGRDCQRAENFAEVQERMGRTGWDSLRSGVQKKMSATCYLVMRAEEE